MKKNDELAELLSYIPSREQRLAILREVKETGKTIAEVADKYAMPPVFQKDEAGRIEYKGEWITPAQFEARFPFRRFCTISTRSIEYQLRK
jgi:hypothetical protein